MRMTRPTPVALTIAALVAMGMTVPVAAPAQAAERTATLVGSLQSEISDCADWTPDCAATDLTLVAGTTTYQRVFEVPAGSYEF